MRDRALAVLLTLAVFSAGLGAGLWAERHRPLPPPPGTLMGEFSGRVGPQAPAVRERRPPVNRAELIEELSRIKPEMEAFTSRVNEIYAQFDRDIDSVLTADQRVLYEKHFRSHRGYTGMPGEGPLTDDQIDQLMQRPYRTLAYFVVIPMTLERMGAEMKLDEGQKAKVKDLLRARREKFIELMDSLPPPSLALSRLAPLAQRLGAPSKPTPTPSP